MKTIKKEDLIHYFKLGIGFVIATLIILFLVYNLIKYGV